MAVCLVRASVVLSGPEGLEHPEKPGAVVLDRDGGRIATLPGRDYYHCEPVPLRAVPEMLVKATLAAEDKRFYSHGGADFLALGRAVVTNAAGGEIVSAHPPSPSSLPKMPILQAKEIWPQK